MCRLFGFRSVLSSGVHSSLVESNNALINQGEKHPDGWGIAYFVNDTPHIIKSIQSVIDDSLFQKVSGIVSSQTVIAHVRKATKGNKTILNSHPFQHGKWVFAHNGNIKNFKDHRDKIVTLIDKDLRMYLLGETDSEVLFFYLLSKVPSLLDDFRSSNSKLYIEVKNAIKELTDIIGDLSTDENADNTENFLTFLFSDGERMLAFHGGQPLFYSTHKNKCPQSADCPHYNKTCENETKDNQVNHFIAASEPLNQENIWNKMKLYDLAVIDHSFNFSVKNLNNV